MPAPNESDVWSARCRDTLSRYAEPLLRSVATRLLKPRLNPPLGELLDRSVSTLTNPPVIDRRVKDLPPAARKLMAAVGLSRQPRWKVGHLISLLAALGHADGFAPVEEALNAGLLYPELPENAPEVADFAAWLGRAGTLDAVVYAHPAVALRARGEDLELPPLTPPEATGAWRAADGLEWPLRLAAVWQQVGAAPVRLTQANTLFKKDLGKLQTDDVLAAPAADQLAAAAEPGVLALYWARAAGLLAEADGELTAGPLPAAWDAGLFPVIASLFAALVHVEPWDPLAGYAPTDTGLSAFPSAALLALLLVRAGPTTPEAVAAWLWEHHPSWAGTLPTDEAKSRGAGWAAAFLLGVAYPLRLVESDGEAVRLSDLGRHLLNGGPEPPPPPAFPQTLLVQPNAEVLAYRQGLTPALIGTLSRFARWKGIGPACTLELTPEQTYRGLESGLTLPMILQTLNRSGTRPVPPSVEDLLQRWSNKRERITVYGSAVLVEFPTPADLEAAVGRGIVSVRLTDRIGMTADGTEPGLTQLRLIGNREYESRPQRCLTIADDGVSLTVDAAQSDLLLEAEIGRYADPLPLDGSVSRRFRITPESIRRAAAHGLGLAEIDAWFQERAGVPLSPAGRLFLLGPQLPPPTVARLQVVRLPTPELTDGVTQWPETRALVADRLGPTVVVVDEVSLPAFREVLAGIGVVL